MSNYDLVDIWRVRNPTLHGDAKLLSNDLLFGVDLCPQVVIIPVLNSNYGQIWLMIEVEIIGNSTAPFLRIISLFLI